MAALPRSVLPRVPCCFATPQLREALRRKVEAENGLPGHEVMVTAGANQAFANVVLGLVDESDRVVLFRPYYFNHLMCLQMTGGAERVVFGKRDPVTMVSCQSESLSADYQWGREV